jgi:hypothetical protein
MNFIGKAEGGLRQDRRGEESGRFLRVFSSFFLCVTFLEFGRKLRFEGLEGEV